MSVYGDIIYSLHIVSICSFNFPLTNDTLCNCNWESHVRLALAVPNSIWLLTGIIWKASPYSTRKVEAAVRALKMGKSVGVDNIPAELVQAGGEAMIDILISICKQDLEDRKMADHMDSIPSYHTLNARQLAAVPRLQNHQPYQPS